MIITEKKHEIEVRTFAGIRRLFVNRNRACKGHWWGVKVDVLNKGTCCKAHANPSLWR